MISRVPCYSPALCFLIFPCPGVPLSATLYHKMIRLIMRIGNCNVDQRRDRAHWTCYTKTQKFPYIPSIAPRVFKWVGTLWARASRRWRWRARVQGIRRQGSRRWRQSAQWGRRRPSRCLRISTQCCNSLDRLVWTRWHTQYMVERNKLEYSNRQTENRLNIELPLPFH